MERNDFLLALYNKLRWKVSPHEINAIMLDYQTYFDEGAIEGKTEVELCRYMPSPVSIAQDILSDRRRVSLYIIVLIIVISCCGMAILANTILNIPIPFIIYFLYVVLLPLFILYSSGELSIMRYFPPSKNNRSRICFELFLIILIYAFVIILINILLLYLKEPTVSDNTNGLTQLFSILTACVSGAWLIKLFIIGRVNDILEGAHFFYSSILAGLCCMQKNLNMSNYTEIGLSIEELPSYILMEPLIIIVTGILCFIMWIFYMSIRRSANG